MGALTPRGEAVNEGYAALADATGDDSLTIPENLPDDNGAADTDVEAETQDPAGEEIPPAGPADIPAPPPIETADEPLVDRETRNP